MNKIIKFIKQNLCSHPGVEATIVENPNPLVLLDAKIKCTDCEKELTDSSSIYTNTVNKYIRRLGESVLFQRNIDKFPEFYENKIKEQHGIKK